MNSLLNLAFFKSLSFPSKEAGMQFIKENKKLKQQIDEKVDELDEVRYNIVEEIKDKIFVKYEDKKEVYLVKVKSQKADKVAHKKQIQKDALKEEMKKELMDELRNEENNEKKNKLKKKFPKAFPEIDDSLVLSELSELFMSVIQKISAGDIDEDEIIVIEKYKKETEKAFEMLKKVKNSLEKMQKV